MGLTRKVQAPHFLFEAFEEAALDECTDSCGGMTLVEQFVACELNLRNGRLRGVGITKGKVEEVNEGTLLTGGTLQHIDGDMQSLLVAELRRQTDAGLGLGTIAVFGLQPRGEGSLIDLSDGRHIVVGHPLPQLELSIEKNGRNVEHLKDILDGVPFRCFLMNRGNEAYINLIPAQWYKYTHPLRHLSLQRWWNGIGEHTVER